MRIVALVLSILGALAALGFGVILFLGTLEAQNDRGFINNMERIRNPNVDEAVRTAQTQRYVRVFALPYFLLASGVLTLLAGMLAMRRHGISAGMLLLVALAGPVALVVGLGMAHTGDDLGRLESSVGATLLWIFIAIPSFFIVLAALFAFLTRPLPIPADGQADDRELSRRPPPRRPTRRDDDDE